MAKVPKQELGRGIRALLGNSDTQEDKRSKKKKASQDGIAKIALEQNRDQSLPAQK